MDMPSEHPMDNIKIRKLDFDVDVVADDLVWSRSNPEFAIFINAIGLHVPYFERYLIAAMTRAKGKIVDEKLKSDVIGIIGQEAHHARNFIAYNKALAQRYPRAAEFEQRNKDSFTRRAKRDSLRQLVGFTAGYETFTFISGMIILDHYERWMHDSNPAVRALWVWHQVEEVEHGAVAFDVNKYLFPDDEWGRKWYVAAGTAHILWETLWPYLHMCRVEGYFKSLKGSWKALSFITWMGARMVGLSLPVFRRSYSPRAHPLVNRKQNPVGFAWRNFEHKEGDILAIDKAKMARILMYEFAD